MGVDNVVVAGWYLSVRVGLVVLMVECAVVDSVKDNGWEVVEDVVDMTVFVEFWVGWLASNSSSVGNDFLVCISLWKLISRSDPRGFVCDSPPLSEIMSFSKMLFSVSLLIWLSMTCEM